jgi:hypothetical protein
MKFAAERPYARPFLVYSDTPEQAARCLTGNNASFNWFPHKGIAAVQGR